jgi:hypothetical protein
MLVKNHEGKKPLEKPWRKSKDNIKISLQEIRPRVESTGSGKVVEAGSGKHGNEPLEFLDQLSNYQLLKEDSVPCST